MDNSRYEKLLAKAMENRKSWGEGDAKRDKGLKEPENVRVIKNVAYTESDTEEEKIFHLADVYYPEGEAPKGGYPVIVSVHGGGWFYGDKELYRFYCMHLATLGFAVVNFNYRLAPEYVYPAGFMDVCALMNFVKANAQRYEFDMDNLFMVGDSAGAQLCSQYCIWATSDKYHKLLDPECQIDAPVPKRVALNCGIYDMKDMKGREDFVEWYLPEDLSKDTDLGRSYYEILEHLNENFPECYVVTSYNDEIKKYTPVLLEFLDKAGVKYVAKEYAKDSPEDGHVFHVNMKSKLGHQCNDDEASFFRA